MFRILAINPGSTSSKVAVYEDSTLAFSAVVEHTLQDLARYPSIIDQYPLRRDAVLQSLESAGISLASLHAVVGRGGMLQPIPSGTYGVNAAMLADLRRPTTRQHVSNLGSILAFEIAAPLGIPAFIVDPVTVDEFPPLARVAGLPNIQRRSESHALNTKAAARRAAQELGRPYAAVNLVVVHLGSGISVSAHTGGRMVDVNQGLDGTGPFSPERAGGLPVGDVMRMAFSGAYTPQDLYTLITRRGGLVAHLGTNDAREVERRIAEGDAHARLVYEALAYQVAKEIGLMATVLKGHVDAIVLTGGLAYSQMLVGWIEERVAWIAPVRVYAGQMEMAALAEGALRVLRGEEEPKEYAPDA
ncbi:MAG: butyrate kinase [Anaerolineae bacterium]